jgi:putative transposase
MTVAMSTTKKAKKPKAPKLFPDELIDQLLAQVQNKDAESILGESGLAGQLKKQLAERMLAAELTHHLDTEARQGQAGNHRNGASPKTVMTPNGELNLDIPRDRQATFEPQLVAKYQRRLPGFDDNVISMYARGMSVREIAGHLQELYGLGVSPELISTITDEVLAEVEQWQQRPLEAMYPIVYFDALRLKILDEGTVRNKAVYLALGIRADGRKEVLGLWIEQTEGANFWLKVFNELKNRGLQDVLIAVVDGLRGFPEAIEAVYPQVQIQTCIVHLIRNSLSLASWKFVCKSLICERLRKESCGTLLPFANRLFSDTEPAENHPQQIIRRKFPGDAVQPVLRQPQLFREQVERLIAGLVVRRRMMRGHVEMVARRLQGDQMAFAREVQRFAGLLPAGQAQQFRAQ